MGMWVVRRDIEGKCVSEPMPCLNPGTIIAKPGYRAVEEYIALLVASDETCVGEASRRPILKRGRPVGYIDISAEIP